MTDVPAPAQEGVFYTDGGCRAMEPGNPASRGYSGWGMHGYLFTRDAPKVGAGVKKGVPSPNGYDIKGSGKGTVTVLEYVDGFATIDGEGTNNIAELQGAIEAMAQALEKNLVRAVVITDSKYVVQGVEQHIAKWKQRGWLKADGQAPANLTLWKHLDEAVETLKARGCKVEFKWVKGHDGDPGNVLADRYATRGVLCQRRQMAVRVITWSPAKGYWKPVYERNRMLNLSNWYLTTSGDMDTVTADGRTIYYTGDIRAEEEFTGKRISDATFAVLYLKEPEPILTLMRECFETLAKGTMQGLLIADLSSIFAPHIYDALVTHGDTLLVHDRNRQSIEHMDKLREVDERGAPLGHELRPTRLAYSAINVMESLEGVLNDVLHPKAGTRVRCTDITDVLYERAEAKGKVTVKLRSAVSVATGSVQAEATYTSKGVDQTKELCLTLGQDLPDRNTLSALALPDTKVQVVTWPESDQAFRFAIVIEAQDSVGIWCGPYANLQLLEAVA